MKVRKMLRRVELKNFRIFKYISQTLEEFEILVGANATGKTTFLDSISFVSDIISIGLESAVEKRVSIYNDLTWSGIGGSIEIGLEFALPQTIISKLDKNKNFDTIRYEIKIGINDQTQELSIQGERVLLMDNKQITYPKKEFTLFPQFEDDNNPVYNKVFKNQDNNKVFKRVVNKKPEGNDSFYPEKYERESSGWIPSFKLGYKKSALANLPADEEKFPASVWLKDYLNEGIQVFMLNSLSIRMASRPGQGKNFRPDGSNLPWVIDEFKKQNKNKYTQWLQHLQTALPDITDINVLENPDNKYKYIKLVYKNNIEVPSWLVSDGTLRLLALTIIAYLPVFKGIYLIEEPENGIHPKAIETVYQSLSSVYDAQILVASHSSIFLSIAELNNILCFGKTSDGIGVIVKGIEHPRLKNWKGETNLSNLFAGGILG
ncbi:MAG: ATP-binding protein [Bacteroidales bacterium]